MQAYTQNSQQFYPQQQQQLIMQQQQQALLLQQQQQQQAAQQQQFYHHTNQSPLQMQMLQQQYQLQQQAYTNSNNRQQLMSSTSSSSSGSGASNSLHSFGGMGYVPVRRSNNERDLQRLKRLEDLLLRLRIAHDQHRIPVSRAARDLKEYVSSTHDPLVPSVWGDSKENPFIYSKDSGSCCM